MCLEAIALRAQNMLTIMSSIINLIGEIYMAIECPRFHNDKVSHMSYKYCETNGYGHELDLLVISH